MRSLKNRADAMEGQRGFNFCVGSWLSARGWVRLLMLHTDDIVCEQDAESTIHGRGW